MKNLTIYVLLAMFIVNIAIFVSKVKKMKNVDHPNAQDVREDQGPLTEDIENKEEDNPKPKPKSDNKIEPDFVKVPVFRKSESGTVYGDVLSHSQETPFGDRAGRATNVHETAHGIHAYLRNKSGSGVNAFYGLEGRGIIIEEPKIRKSYVNKFVPQNLRSYRYALYLDGQKEWDDSPLYICDEWNAYVLGGKCNVDDVQNGRYKGAWSDGVSGCLDFSIYSIALSMAIQKGDPSYWENNKQFRSFMIWNLREAYKTYMLGRRMEQFKWDKQDALLKEFLTSASAELMRKFVRENFDGIWLDVDPEKVILEYGPHQSKPIGEDLIKPRSRASYRH
jgi:hypothetical protein